MEIVTEITGNASMMLKGAVTAMEEAKRQIRFANPSDLDALKKLDKALAFVLSAIDQVASLRLR